jgi:CRISPR/Cas system CSM-associated protein Csm4 (group 5 of RAMP superfamily)
MLSEFGRLQDKIEIESIYIYSAFTVVSDELASTKPPIIKPNRNTNNTTIHTKKKKKKKKKKLMWVFW